MNILKILGAHKATTVTSNIAVFKGVANFTANASTYTYTAAPLGTPATGRLVVVVAGGNSSTAGLHTVTNVTVAGNTATNVISTPSQQRGGGIWQIVDSTNTTANIVVTFTDAVFRASIAVYVIYNLASSTAESSGGVLSTSGVASLTLNGTAGGTLIAMAVSGNESTDSSDFPWVNATRNFKSYVESSLNFGGAFNLDAAASQTIEINPTPGYQYRLLAARWK